MWCLSGKEKLAAALLFTFIVAVYVCFVQNTVFVYDDFEQIESIRAELSVSKLKLIFGSSHYSNFSYYRPLCRLLLNIEKLAFGNNPWIYRLFNSCLVAGIALLVYLLLIKQKNRFNFWINILIPLCIAFHPISAEMVYIITCQEVLLVVLFSILTCYFFYKDKKILSGICLYLALLSRENAFVVPAIIFLFLWLVKKSGFKFTLKDTSYLFVIDILYLIQRFLVLTSSSTGDKELSAIGPLLSYVYMVQNILFPSIDLLYEPSTETWLCLEYTIPTIVIIICSVYFYKKNISDDSDKQCLLFLLIWIILMYLPTSNILRQQSSYDNRHCMVALPPLILMIAFLFKSYILRYAKQAIVLILVVFLCYGCIAYHQRIYFYNELNFAIRWIQTSPDSKDALRFTSMVLLKQNKLPEAEALLVEGIKEGFDATLFNNLAVLYQRQRKYDKAEPYLLELLAKNPSNRGSQYNLAINQFFQNKYFESLCRFLYVKACDNVESNVNIDSDLDKFIAEAYIKLLIGTEYNK